MSKNIKLQWHNETRFVNDLVPCKQNPNTNTDIQFGKLKKSISTSGYVEPIVIDIDGTIIAGEHRWRAMIELRRTKEAIDVRVPNRKLTQEEFDRYLIASNALHGTWNIEKLNAINKDLLVDLLDEDDLSTMWNSTLRTEDDDFDVAKEIQKIKKPKTRLGDILLLGPHKLICGNANDPTVLKRLFGKEKASMIYSDPIYNLHINYNAGIGGTQHYGGNVNDNRTDSEYKEFLRKSLINALSVTKDDAHVFYWSDQTYIGLIQDLYRECGIVNKRVCLWIKNSQNPVPGVAFNKCYEPCTYGIRGKPYINNKIQNLNEVLNKEITTGNNLITEALDHLDLWFVKRLSGKEYEHATSKPPKLHEKAIRRCTKPGDIILDSFSGSFSTGIAADQLKRRVYAVELEETFCDLAALRYKRLTGVKPKIIHYHEEK